MGHTMKFATATTASPMVDVMEHTMAYPMGSTIHWETHEMMRPIGNPSPSPWDDPWVVSDHEATHGACNGIYCGILPRVTMGIVWVV